MSLRAVAVAGRGLVDPSAPVFLADDEALLRGAAAFETVRIRRSRAVFLREHVSRLARSADALGLPATEGADALVRSAVEASALEEGVVRLFRTSSTLVATAAELPSDLEALRARGIAMVTLPVQRAGLLSGVKATSYALALAAIAEAGRRAADDALYVDERGTVLEATMSNIWWRVGHELSTPSLATGVLPGVTRAAVLTLARTAGFEVREDSFDLAALLSADEAFTSSAVREIMPVVAVDGEPLPRGSAAGRLQTLLEQASGE